MLKAIVGFRIEVTRLEGKAKLNQNHPRYAWYSLFSVALVDLYIFLLATGTIQDVRFF